MGELDEGAIVLHRPIVEPDWIDYNGHMTEWRYGQVFADAGDALLLYVGFDQAYRDSGRGSFYTVETHIRFLHQLAEGDQLEVSTQVLGVDGKRLHLFHWLRHEEIEAATCEAMLLHVDLDTGKVRAASEAILVRLRNLVPEGSLGPRPDSVGRSIREI